MHRKEFNTVGVKLGLMISATAVICRGGGNQ